MSMTKKHQSRPAPAELIMSPRVNQMISFLNKLAFVGVLSILAFFPGRAVAQTSAVTVGTTSGSSGTSVDLPVSFAAGGTGVSTLQFDLTLPVPLSYVSVATGSAAAAAGKSASARAISGGVRVLIFGLNQNTIGSGAIAVVRLNIASGTAPGSLVAGITGIVASSPNGAGVSINGVGGSVTVIAPALPTVTISATDPSASETGPGAGVFTVTRSGSTSGSLTANYTASGTATAGSDYTALAGSVTLGSGAATATITVTPTDDTAVEANETVILTLASSATYAIGSPSSATVTIADNDTDTTVPVISGISASSITTTGAVINWTTNELSDTQVEYGTTTVYSNSTALVPRVTTHAVQLAGLQAATLYHYRVKSQDAAGNLAVSGDFTFTTAQETLPPGDVKNFTALPGNGQVTLSWTNPSDTDFSGVLIRYRTDGIFPVNKDNGTLVLNRPGLPNANESFLQSGLTNGTTYYYSAFTYDTSQNYSMTAHAQASPAGPTILALSPNYGRVDTEVKISGTNFGSTVGSNLVTFTGVPASVLAWSNTSITAKVPVGAKSGPVIVIANGVQSNSVNFKVSRKLPAPGQVRVTK
jgi:Calx-beta domain/IPT/TIG domain/Cohesin domain